MPLSASSGPRRIERQRMRQAPYRVDKDDEGAMILKNDMSQQALSETPVYETFARDKDTTATER